LPKGRLPGDRTGAALEDLIERAVTRALERTGLAKDKPEKAGNYSGPDVLRRDGVSGVGYFFANRAASMVLASSRSNSSGSNSSPIQSIRSACSGWVGLARMASISS